MPYATNSSGVVDMKPRSSSAITTNQEKPCEYSPSEAMTAPSSAASTYEATPAGDDASRWPSASAVVQCTPVHEPSTAIQRRASGLACERWHAYAVARAEAPAERHE